MLDVTGHCFSRELSYLLRFCLFKGYEMQMEIFLAVSEIPYENTGFKIIADFIESVGRARKGDPIFRGHAASSWDPIPSAYRQNHFGLTSVTLLGHWKNMVKRVTSPKPASDLEYLILAQHYGIKTPLLDWTTNPLIALFFACTGDEKNKDSEGAVISTNRSLFRSCDDVALADMFAEDFGPPFLVDASAFNTRANAQDSIMSLHSSNPSMGIEFDFIFRIEAKNKNKTLNALKQFGVSEERVYSDVVTAAKQFNNMYDYTEFLG